MDINNIKLTPDEILKELDINTLKTFSSVRWAQISAITGEGIDKLFDLCV